MQFDLLDNAHNQILNQTDYASFAKALRGSNCQRCPLGQNRNHIVIDRGNPKAKIMVISERPGENEDMTGQAFVGRAGEMLDKIMASINLNSDEDLLIINVVKCLPPTDRSPLSPEVEACRPYLDKQIALVQPKVILLLGAVAYKYVSDSPQDFSMESEAGKFFTLPEYPDIQFMVLYHPAFLLRDPTKKKEMWEHVQKLKNYLNSQHR